MSNSQIALVNRDIVRQPMQQRTLHAGLAVLAVLLTWSYWPTIGAMAAVWAHDPQYSHGFLVPLFAGVLLWHRRHNLQVVNGQLNPWGLVLLLLSALLRLTGAYYFYHWFDMISLIPCLAGVVVLWGGWPALRWSWPGIAFLLFMLPLPYAVGSVLAPTLQLVATAASTYTLQTLGFPAIAEGNIIILNDARIGVVEACGGLSMLMVFFALTTAVAVIVPRGLPDKGIIVLSAIPIAIITNVARITVTAILHDGIGASTAELFHDLAGWFMMPLALASLWLELQIMDRLLIHSESVTGLVNR